MLLPEELLKKYLDKRFGFENYNVLANKKRTVPELLNSVIYKNLDFFETDKTIPGRLIDQYENISLFHKNSKESSVDINLELRKSTNKEFELLNEIPKTPGVFLSFIYWDLMSEKEKKSTVLQVLKSIGETTKRWYITNIKVFHINNDDIVERFSSMYNFDINKFVKKEIPPNTIVLDPYSKNEFEFEKDKFYFVLALTDKGNRLKGITSKFADEYGLETMSLKYNGKHFPSNLTINQVVEFLIHTFRGCSKEEALMKIVPPRILRRIR